VESPECAVMGSNSYLPEIVADLLEVQGRMKRVLLPHLIRLCRQATHIARQTSIESPEVARGDAGNPHGALSLRSSSSTVSSGTHMPAAASALDCSISWSRRPLTASAFIRRSQSSSTVGCSIAISSQYSCGLRDSMAAFISGTVVMFVAYHSPLTPSNENPWLVSPSISSTLLSGERIPASPIRRQSATVRRYRDGGNVDGQRDHAVEGEKLQSHGYFPTKCTSDDPLGGRVGSHDHRLVDRGVELLRQLRILRGVVPLEAHVVP